MPVILPDDDSDSVILPDQTPCVESEPPEPRPVILSGDVGTVILDQSDSVVIVSTDAPPPSTGLTVAQARKLAFLAE